MFCENCGKEVEDNWVKCPYCAAVLKKTNDTDEQEKSKIESNGEEVNVARVPKGSRLITKRSFWKYLLLSFVTCGIYGIYALYVFTEDINSLCEGDGQKSQNYIVVLLLTLCTLGIYGFYWWYKQAERLKVISPNYGIAVKESGTTILLWQTFGSLLFGLGSFVATYIMFDNVNRLALVYNGEKTSEEVQAMGDAHPKLVRNVIIAAGIVFSAFLLLLFLLIVGMALYDGGDMTETAAVVENAELAELDLEDLIGKSVEEIESLGFEQSEDYLDYGAFSGAVQINTLEGKVEVIMIEDNGEALPKFAGVAMGMTEEEACAAIQEKYPYVIEDEKGGIFLNLETKGGVRYTLSDGRVSSLVYMELSEDMVEEYGWLEEENKEETMNTEQEESQTGNMNELDIAEYRNVGIEALMQNVELEKVEDTYTDKNETTFIKTDENGIITEIVIKGDSEDALKHAPSFGGVELGLPAFSVDLFMQHANLVKLYADMYIEGTYEDKASDYVIYGQEENTYNSLTIKSKLLDAAESDKKVYEIAWKANGVTGENLIQYGYHDVNAEKSAAEEAALRAEYIFPDSDKKYLSEDEVRQATVEQMYIGRNEIFARHGYIFMDEMLQQHFGATSWYQGTTPGAEFQMEAVFNDFEMKNVELIKRIEDEVNGTSEAESEEQSVINEVTNFLVGHSFHLKDSQPVIEFISPNEVIYCSGGDIPDEYYNYSISARYDIYKDEQKAWLTFLTIDGVEYYFRYFEDGTINLSSSAEYAIFNGWYEFYR